MKIKLQVTEEDISKGIQKDSDDCPIALACKRILNPGFIGVYGPIKIEVDGHSYISKKNFYEFISDFDNGYSVQPFEEEVEFIEDEPEPDYNDEYDWND